MKSWTTFSTKKKTLEPIVYSLLPPEKNLSSPFNINHFISHIKFYKFKSVFNFILFKFLNNMILYILLNTKNKTLIMKWNRHLSTVKCEPRVDNNANNSEICEPIMFVNDTKKVDATYYYLVNILGRGELPNVKICTKIRNNCILCRVTNVACL